MRSQYALVFLSMFFSKHRVEEQAGFDCHLFLLHHKGAIFIVMARNSDSPR